MRVVVAVGGNALIRRGESAEAQTQRLNVRHAAASVRKLAQDHDVVVTHGNGPQVGLLALQADAYTAVGAYPLDILGAESEGMIGYLLEQALHSELPHRELATLLTQVEVDPADPAFAAPTKPIGPVYDERTAAAVARSRGWTMRPDGAGYRRVVPSPEPRRIVEIEAIRLLVSAGVIVICSGGGGIPIHFDEDGAVVGVEAVIDKDYSAALLALQLDAEALLLLTDVDAVYDGWGTPETIRIESGTPARLRGLMLAPGSMGPKVEAACRFAEATGKAAYIGALNDPQSLFAGRTGTRIHV